MDSTLLGSKVTVLGPYMMDLGGRGHDEWTGRSGHVLRVYRDGTVLVRLACGLETEVHRGRLEVAPIV